MKILRKLLIGGLIGTFSVVLAGCYGAIVRPREYDNIKATDTSNEPISEMETKKKQQEKVIEKKKQLITFTTTNMINFIKTKLLNLYKKLETKEHPLLYLFLEITQICNLDCLHCGSDCQKNMAKDELTTKSWKKIISYIKENFGKNVTFIITGGEPLVHRDLDELTQHIKSENMRWSMVSNGHLLTKERLHTLIGNGLYSITVSLDGSKDIHNYLRNNTHSYARVITALSEIGKSGVLSDVVTCVYPKNLYKLDYIAHILLENNIKNWRLFRIFPSGRAKGNNELLLSYKQTWDMLHWIAEKRPYYKKEGTQSWCQL